MNPICNKNLSFHIKESYPTPIYYTLPTLSPEFSRIHNIKMWEHSALLKYYHAHINQAINNVKIEFMIFL